MRIIRTAGYSTAIPIDTDRFPDREKQGLEGPFRTRSGHVLYYDRREGRYYDPQSDMYVSNEEYEVMNNPRDLGAIAQSVAPRSFTQIFDNNREKKKSEMHKEGDEEKKTKKWPDYDPNPWAVCTDSVGREEKDKYERCVKKVKQKAAKANKDRNRKKDESNLIKYRTDELVDPDKTYEVSEK